MRDGCVERNWALGSLRYITYMLHEKKANYFFLIFITAKYLKLIRLPFV